MLDKKDINKLKIIEKKLFTKGGIKNEWNY